MSYFMVFFGKKKKNHAHRVLFFLIFLSSFLMMRNPADISDCLCCSEVTEVGGFYLPAMCALAQALCCKSAGPGSSPGAHRLIIQNILFGRWKFADTSVNMHLLRKTKAVAVLLTPERSTSPLSASSFNRLSDPRTFFSCWCGSAAPQLYH